MNKNFRPKVEIFSPVEFSSCSFSVWITKVWNILQEYQGNLEIVSLTLDSPRAKELGVDGRTIVVNKQVTPVWELDHKLRSLLAAQ
jgi:hypothetical protein